jgi:hypothetical protein
VTCPRPNLARDSQIEGLTSRCRQVPGILTRASHFRGSPVGIFCAAAGSLETARGATEAASVQDFVAAARFCGVQLRSAEVYWTPR